MNQKTKEKTKPKPKRRPTWVALMFNMNGNIAFDQVVPMNKTEFVAVKRFIAERRGYAQ